MARVLLFAVLVALPASAGARLIEPPLADGLRAAQSIVVARVLAVGHDGEAVSARLGVLATLKGGVGATEIRVSSPPGLPERLLGGERWFPQGGRMIALITTSKDGWTLVPQRGRIELGDAEPTLAEIREFVGGYLRAIERSEADLEAVKTYLRSRAQLSDPLLRELVLRDLGPLLTKADLPFLSRIYSDPTQPEHSRRWAVTSTGVLEPDTVPPDLEALLEPGESVELRRAVLQAFGSRDDPAYLPLLARGLEDPDPDVRVAAVQGLGFPGAVPSLRDRFEREPDHGVRLAIVRRLATIPGAEALSAVQTILDQSSDETIHEAAQELLGLRGSP